MFSILLRGGGKLSVQCASIEFQLSYLMKHSTIRLNYSELLVAS